MDPAYLSAVSALAGSVIGGLTALAQASLNNRAQTTAQRRTQERAVREALYQRFIEEASRLYADALERDGTEISALVNLHALICNIRLRASLPVAKAAEAAGHGIILAYAGPNRTFKDLVAMSGDMAMDPLRDFSEACRKELADL